VPDAHRRRGVGTLLMRAIFETAGTLGCSRVEWTTDAGNIAAQAFYAKLGLPRTRRRSSTESKNTARASGPSSPGGSAESGLLPGSFGGK